MPLIPLCLPTVSHTGLQGRGAQGSWQLPGEVSWHSLTHLSGTPSFPSEEEAAATVKAPAVPVPRVYIFFTKSSGIVHLFFKTPRGEEPCIICKHCIIGYVVQSLFYSGPSGSCHRKDVYGLPTPSRTYTGPMSPPPSPTDSDQSPRPSPRPSSSLPRPTCAPLPVATLPPSPLSSLLTQLPQPFSSPGVRRRPPLALMPAPPLPSFARVNRVSRTGSGVCRNPWG